MSRSAGEEGADWIDSLLVRVNRAAETEAAALADYVTAELIAKAEGSGSMCIERLRVNVIKAHLA